MTQETGSATPMSQRMQSLLSRAVEDQLSEQRQLATALSEVRSHLGRLSDELAMLRATPVPSDEGVDRRLGSLTAELRELSRVTGERFDDVARLVGQRSDDLADIRSSVAAVEERSRLQAEALRSVTGALQSLPSYGDRVAALADTLGAMQHRLTALDDLREGNQILTARLADLRGDLGRSGDVDGPDTGQSDIADRLAAIERVVSQLGPMLGEVGDASHDQTGSIEDLKLRFAAVEEELRGRGAAPRSVDPAAHIDALSRSVEGRLAALQVDVTSIGGSVAGLVEGSVDRRVIEAATAAARDTAEQLSVIDELSSEIRDLRITSREAVDAMERRLATHIDEAVFALAEALLRRRPPGIDLDAGVQLEPIPYQPPAVESDLDVLSNDVALDRIITRVADRADHSPLESDDALGVREDDLAPLTTAEGGRVEAETGEDDSDFWDPEDSESDGSRRRWFRS